MTMIMKLVGIANGPPSRFDGEYLLDYDPDQLGYDQDGQPMLCHLATTPDRDKAKRFADLAELRDCWARQVKSRPVRPDGAPNRPLTAFSIEPITWPV